MTGPGYVPLEPLSSGGDGSSLAALLATAYHYLVVLSVVLAVIFLTVGAVRYLLSESFSDVEKAKAQTRSALFGLIIVIGSFLILYSINPDLLIFDRRVTSWLLLLEVETSSVSMFSAGFVIYFLYSRTTNTRKWFVLSMLGVSVTTCIVGFALAYQEFSRASPEIAFNIKAPLSITEALYFSVVTFATVGYGDIAPTQDWTRLLACAEILISLVYSVMIFSMIGGFIRQDRKS
ncbi:potassium channel family protein [Bradyrhizobium guangxiense]|nr:MAG: two pore domain potassium channel family protein [Bradyrhizobiaceae bacterium]